MPYIDYVNESMRSPEQELEDLKRANDFTDADLGLNRVGKISKGQISRLISVFSKTFVVTSWCLAPTDPC